MGRDRLKLIACLSARVGQNRIASPYMTINLVISLPKRPNIHRKFIWSWPTSHMVHSSFAHAQYYCCPCQLRCLPFTLPLPALIRIQCTVTSHNYQLSSGYSFKPGLQHSWSPLTSISFSWWRSCTKLGTRVAPFPSSQKRIIFVWGMLFNAYTCIPFNYGN